MGAGRRQAAICAGVKPPGLYTSMTGSDAKHPLVLITVSRYSCPTHTRLCSAALLSSVWQNDASPKVQPLTGCSKGI